MSTLIFEEATTATAANTVIAEKSGLGIVPYARRILKIAVTGSSAAGAGAFDLFIGQTFIGRYKVTSTGTAPVEAKDYKMVGWIAGPAEPVICKIGEVSGTNIMRAEIVTAP